MSSFLRQSTSQAVRIGPFVDSTDGVTPETGLTIANTDIDLSKDGGAFASKNSGGATVDGSNGWYSATLDTTDTATVGIFLLEVTVAGALPVWHEYFVVEEAVYDALYAASAPGYLQSTVAARTLDVTATGAAGVDWGNVENPTTSVDLSATSINLCDTTTTNTDMRGTDSANTVVPPSVAQFNARTLVAADYFDPAADTVANVTTVATTTTNTDMRGTDSANTVVPPSVAQFDARTLPTASYFDPAADIVANVTTVATTTTNTDMRGTDSALTAASAPTNFTDLAITVTTGEVTVGTNNDKTGYSISGTTTTLDGLNDLSAAEVNAEVVDVLTVDTFAESGSVPAATSTILDKLNWLFTLGRNKITQTSTTQTLRDDADSSDVATATVSDDGTTFVRNEYT